MIVSIFLAILTFFSAKKNGVSTSKAALAGLAVGAGAFAIADGTDWGRNHLKSIDDAILGRGTPGTQLRASDGSVVTDSLGNPIMVQDPSPLKTGTQGTSITSRLLDAAAGFVTGAVATRSSWGPWLLGGLLLYVFWPKQKGSK